MVKRSQAHSYGSRNRYPRKPNKVNRLKRAAAGTAIAAAAVATVYYGAVAPYQEASHAADAEQQKIRDAVAEQAAPVLNDIGAEMLQLWQSQQAAGDVSDGVQARFDVRSGTVKFTDFVQEDLGYMLDGYDETLEVSVTMGLDANGQPDPSKTSVVYMQNVHTIPEGKGHHRVYIMGPNSDAGQGYTTGSYYRTVEQSLSPYGGPPSGHDSEHVELGGMFGYAYGSSPDEAIENAASDAQAARDMWADYLDLVNNAS